LSFFLERKKPAERDERAAGKMERAMTQSTTSSADVQHISLLDSLDGEWLKLPMAVMQDVGPATQTLGGILKITNKETFVAAAKIAGRARLPLATVRKHLVTLADRGWLANHGRGHTRGGRPRRTCTISLTSRTRDALAEYSVLPWWACCDTRNAGRLSWSARAVLSLIMARLMTLRAAAEQQDGHGMDVEDIEGAIENMGGDERFCFRLAVELSRIGLSRDGAIQGKRELDRLGIIRITSGDRDDGGTPCDLLVPNSDFRVVVTPVPHGRCYVSFQKKGGA
jgi:hypothetical protein